MKKVSIKSNKSRTWLREGGKPAEGLTTFNFVEFPSREDGDHAYQCPAILETFEDRLAMSTIKNMLKIRWDGQVHRIAAIHLPDRLKGYGWGKAMILARMQYLGKNTALYNSQASPELAAATAALDRDGFIELHGNPRRSFVLMLTEKGEKASPFDWIRSKQRPPRWMSEARAPTVGSECMGQRNEGISSDSSGVG